MDTSTRLRELAISENGFIFDPRSGATFTGNPTAVELLRGLMDGRSRPELLAALSQKFTIGDHDLQRDLADFVLLLRQQGLVPEDFSAEEATR